jgi:transposase InsO family protein
MKNDRVVVPTELRGKLLRLAHATHPGVVRTKQRLRPFYWWPQMDKQVEEMVNGCMICQSSDKSAKTFTAPMQPVARPSGPWKKVAIDIVGPMDYLPAHCRYAFTLVDYFSRWPEVGFSSDISASAVIKFLNTLFSREGYPQELISDHGVQFTSHEFEAFLLARNIKHSFSAIYHPAANGLCERFNRAFKEAIQVSKNAGRETKSALLDFLAAYRSTPHATTGVSPKELFHGRSMHVGLCIPELHNPQVTPAAQVDKKVAATQLAAKLYTDQQN